MQHTLTVLRASLGAADLLRMPRADSRAAGDEPSAAQPPVLVPIRSVGPGERERICTHLLALDPHDRYLRFGYAASDEQVRRYVEGLDFERDDIFGIYNRRLDLIAMAHLAFAPQDRASERAEFGVSVSRHARGRGYGARLFERAEVAARNAGVRFLLIHALSENAAMLKIARNAGASVVRSGAEAEALLALAEPTLDSRMSEIALKQFAEIDFQLKSRAKQFWTLLRGAQDARDKTPA